MLFAAAASVNDCGVSVAGVHIVPFHLIYCPVVADCCAISNGLPDVPFPVSRELTATAVKILDGSIEVLPIAPLLDNVARWVFTPVC